MKNGGQNSKKQGYKSEDSIVFLAEKIIENAINLRATDVHIEPREDHSLVRFRIHGSLQEFEKITQSQAKKLVKHFKFIGGLDFSEKTFSQSAKIKHGKANIRISIAPTFLGEKVTLRILSAKSRVRSLEEIGLWGENLRLVRQAIRQPNGIIITLGIGKNNTNFAILNELSSSEKSIITVENHIEKAVPNITQTEVNLRVGLDYSRTTKAALSQNPDIILIDDLRDKKTAEIAFDAASRGKLLIISLPIQKTSEVIPYLEFLGVPNFLISANLLAIISQNLVRTVSNNALESRKISKTESKVILAELQTNISKIHQLEIQAKKHFGGKKLHTSEENILELSSIKPEFTKIGYTGLTGIFEVASLIDGKFGRNFRNLITSKPNAAEIEEFLEENNFTSLKVDGLIKALQNQTTIKEVIRRTGY